MNNLLGYETRCRRCNYIEYRLYWDEYKDNETWMKFAKEMHSRIDHPLSEDCRCCLKPTICEIVWFQSPDASKPLKK